MTMRKQNRQSGFSLLEMLVVVLIFGIITGVVFQLLDLTQRRYYVESAVLDSFQGARLAIDQLTRDIHSSGYPPANQFMAAVAAANPQRVAIPFAFSPGYPVSCNMGVCRTPNQWDLIVEGNPDPTVPGSTVQWIRYRLNGRTLERGAVAKVAGGVDPAVATAAGANMVPFVENVVNNTTAAEMTQIRTFYPAMFPGNTPVPVFTYMCQVGTNPLAVCTGANTPRDIREVNITLIVRSPADELRNRQPRVVTLTARARRINPAQ